MAGCGRTRDQPEGQRRGPHDRRGPRERRGSALILVLVMTLSLAGLAISAVLLTSSASLVQRYYDKEKDFRFFAMAAVARAKSAVQRDTTLSIPPDTALRVLSGARIADASGETNGIARVNAYAAFTGDTAGTYVPFVTILAQAYDTMGVRSVQRLDLRADAFSRYALFTDTTSADGFPAGQVVRGRVHANRSSFLASGTPASQFYDTVTVSGAITGAADYRGIPAVTGAPRRKWPTTASLASLGALGTAGKLAVNASGTTAWGPCTTTNIDLTGRYSPGCLGWLRISWPGQVRSGTRVFARPVDVNNNGTFDAEEGFFEVFDLAAGMDTSTLRADLPVSAVSVDNIVLQNQCGLMVTIGGQYEFFPVARFREAWVRTRVQLSTSPVITAADAADMVGSGGSGGESPGVDAVHKILGYGPAYSRCFPAGSPYLMLTERYVGAGGCTVTTNTSDVPYGWAAAATTCPRYGGQDTTFTPTVTRCRIGTSTAGRCDDYQVALGSWVAFGGVNTANPPASVIQAVEKPYLWPISSTFNAASRGVAYAAATNPLFVDGTLRGYLTLFARGGITLTDDLVYDVDPLQEGNTCRNFLGLIAAGPITVANSAINRPRPDASGTYRFLGTPHYSVQGVLMSLGGVVGVESPGGNQATVPAVGCNGASTSGGCFNVTGGIVAKAYAATTTGTGSGLVLNMTRDPCQARATGRRPPFFPLTGAVADYKAYELDPRRLATWDSVKVYISRLRGNNRAVP